MICDLLKPRNRFANPVLDGGGDTLSTGRSTKYYCAMMTPTNLQRRLLFILHRALVETRLLAQAGKAEQILDLADALEPLPGWMDDAWKDKYLDAVRSNLETYAKKYPGAFGYLDFIDKYEPPSAF